VYHKRDSEIGDYVLRMFEITPPDTHFHETRYNIFPHFNCFNILTLRLEINLNWLYQYIILKGTVSMRIMSLTVYVLIVCIPPLPLNPSSLSLL
jgi:hypothetical protein